jgi:hypothetical protein
MGTDDFCFPAQAGQCALHHLMGDRVSEDDQKIRGPDSAFHIRAGFTEHLCLASVFPADIRVLPFHAFISAKNDNAHKVSPFTVSLG